MKKVLKTLTVLLLIALATATGSFVIAALPVNSRMPDLQTDRTPELINVVNSRPVVIYAR